MQAGCEVDHRIRTYVRMTSYLISDPAKPWLTLFSSHDLRAVAEAVSAQPQLDLSGIYATLDGKPRALTEVERGELSRHLSELDHDHPHGPTGGRRPASDLAGSKPIRAGS